MKIRILLSLLCLLIVVSGCRKPDPQLEVCENISLMDADVLGEDDRAIYNLILDSYYRDRNARLLQRVGSETQAEWIYSTVRAFQITVDSAVVENYALRNQQTRLLPDEFFAPLLPMEEFDCLLNANPNEDGFVDFYQNFYAKYPDSGGYIDFDIPGYDASRTHAILQYGIYYGSLGANGSFVVFEKVNGQWTIVLRQNTWVS